MRTLIGRDRELAALVRELERSRLVTVLGPAGIGKTSLARALLARHADGHFVDLTHAASGAEAAATLAAALGMAAGADEPELSQRVAETLQHHDGALVVLDNCDGVAPSLSQHLERWLATAPTAHFLLTSRSALNTPHEVSFELGPLPVPPRDSEALTSAVELFLHEARRVRPDFDGELDAVREIVRRMEGNPYAVALAASRLGVLSARAVLETLPSTLSGSLADAVEWSWKLLSGAEKDVLARCAVLDGNFGLDAANAIAGVDATQIVDALRAKSLLRVETAPTGEPRFAMHLGVRELSLSKLSETDRRDALWRLSRHFARKFGDVLRPEAHKPTEREVRARLLDATHLATGAAFMLAEPPTRESVELAARLLLAMEPMTAARGGHGELTQQMTDLLTIPRVDQLLEPPLVTRLLIARARIGIFASRFDDSERDATAALERARLYGDLGEQALAHDALGTAAFYAGRLDVAHASFAEAHTLAERARHPIEGDALHGLTWVHLERAELDAAEVTLTQTADFLRTREVTSLHMLQLEARGWLALERGHGAEALDHMDHARRVAETLEHRRGGAYLAGCRALFALEVREGDGAALSELERAGSELRRQGAIRAVALFRLGEGVVHLRAGRLAEARARLDRTARHPSSPDVDRVGDALEGLLQIELASREQGEASAELLAEAEAKQGRAARDSSVVVRWAARLLHAALRKARAAAGEPAPDALVVHTGGEWFVLPRAAKKVALSRRAALRRLLSAFIEARHRGSILTVAALAEAGWPGERMLTAAATNRVHVAIATLRRLGLRDALIHRDGGYGLDPSLPLVIADEAPRRVQHVH